MCEKRWLLFIVEYCYIPLNCILYSYSCVKAITPNVTVFGNRALKEVIKVKRAHKGRALIQ